MNRGFARRNRGPRPKNRNVFQNGQKAHNQETPNPQTKPKKERDNQGRALRASVRNVPQPVPALNAGASPSVRCLTHGSSDRSVSGQPVIRQDRSQRRKSLPTSQVIGTDPHVAIWITSG